MYALVITLAPYEIDDDPNLRGFILNNNDKDTVMSVLNAHYSGIDPDSVHFYDASPTTDATGSFTTVEMIDEDDEYDDEYDDEDDEEFRLNWLFEVQEAYPQP